MDKPFEFYFPIVYFFFLLFQRVSYYRRFTYYFSREYLFKFVRLLPLLPYLNIAIAPINIYSSLLYLFHLVENLREFLFHFYFWIKNYY